MGSEFELYLPDFFYHLMEWTVWMAVLERGGNKLLWMGESDPEFH